VDIVSVGTDGLIQVWTGDGAGAFSAGWSGYTVSASIGEATALVDFDGDGDLDLALGDADGMALLFRGLVNDGGGTFDVASPVTASVPSPMVTGMVGADLDGDGVDEVVSGGMLDRRYEMFVGGYKYDAGAFSTYYGLATPSGSSVTSLSVGDLDGDGVADLFASNALYMRGELMFQRGPGAWEQVEVDLGLWYQSDVFPDSSAVGDLNGDGCGDLVWRTDLDVIVAAGSGC
jgi:hypothetical protein